MFWLQSAADALIDRLRERVTPHTFLIERDDVFEVKRTPSLVLQGPDLTEHEARRSMEPVVSKDIASLTYELDQPVRFYHADFEVILTCAKQAQLFELQAKVLDMFASLSYLDLSNGPKLGITEITPMGGLKKPNLSNLRQSVGRYRIEDVPLMPGETVTGKLITTVVTEFRDEDTSELIGERTYREEVQP